MPTNLHDAAPAIVTLLLAILPAVLIPFVDATVLNVVNGGGIKLCIKYWVPNAEVGGGCRELAPGQAWNIEATPEWQASTMWAFRGDCNIHHSCNTGPPSGVTQFEFTIGGSGGVDYYDISTLVGFNMGISIQPTNSNCSSQSCITLDRCEGALPDNPNSVKTCPYGTTDYTITFYSF